MLFRYFIIFFLIIDLYGNVDLTNEEKEWIKDNPIVTVGGEVDWAPFDFVNAHGKYDGISNDYLQLISKKSGLKFDIITGYTWSELVENFKNKKFDILPAIYYSKDRKNIGNYSAQYYTVEDYLFVNDSSDVKSMEDLNGKVLAIVKGYATIQEVKAKYPKVRILETRSIVDSIASVLTAQADATLEVHSVMDHTIITNVIKGIKIVRQGTLGKTPLHMLVQKDKTILLSILNKTIISIDKNEQKYIADKWLITAQEESFLNSKQALYLLISFLVIIFLFMYRQYILRNINKSLEKDKKIIERYLKIVDQNVITSSTDLTGKITYVSEAFCKTNGYTKDELIGKNHNIVRHPDMPKFLYEDIWKSISSNITWSGEIKNRKKDGGYYWVLTTISPTFDDNEKQIGYTAIAQDITDKKQIEIISITDGLTKIYNRRHFDTLFPHILEMNKRNNEVICFLIMDIDYFKKYNDTYGHQMGDDALIKIAGAIKSNIKRADDYCFRLGGEEFGVLFKINDTQDALVLANSFKIAIEELKIPHSENSVSEFITASMGLVCLKAREIKNVDEIYKQADDLLYISKESGRNKITYNQLI